MKFYTADRFETLSEGLILEPIKITNVAPSFLQTTLDNWFPQGLSKHGLEFFCNPKATVEHNNTSLEIIYELVRRAEFPDKPSRYDACVFATDTPEQAREFAISTSNNVNPTKWNNTNAPIWEVESNNYFKADMKLLGVGSPLITVGLAQRYWREEASETPFWEYLLYSPVKVIRRIEM